MLNQEGMQLTENPEFLHDIISVKHIIYNPTHGDFEVQFSHMRDYLLKDFLAEKNSLFLIEPIFLKLVYSYFLKNLYYFATTKEEEVLIASYEYFKTCSPENRHVDSIMNCCMQTAVAFFLIGLSEKDKEYVFDIGIEKLKKYEKNSKHLLPNEAMRDNSSKVDHSLFCSVLPEFAECLVEGAKKYSANNWKKQMDPHQIINSLINHLEKYLCGEIHDKDSGNTHISHGLCNCMFLEYHCNTNSTIKKLRSVPQSVDEILAEQ
jgi:hypothetical protein